jgi:hypothetical protein
MFEGECFCGVIGYRIDGALIEPRSCHCSRCRKVFSGSGSAYAEVTAGTFSWARGEPALKIFGDTAGFAVGFCSHCGSTLCGLFNGTIHGITLGTLNGDPPLTIEKHLFVASKATWDIIGGDAPRYSGALPSKGT